MRKIKLYVAQSIDGYIATLDGGVEWLNDSLNEDSNNDYGYSNFYNSIDTTLMGYNTYKEILGFDVPFPYPDKENYVFSRNHTKQEDLPVKFVSSDICDFVSELKKSKGKDIWLIGGGKINKVLLNNDLIDEIIITIKTVILGEGIPLFSSGTEFKKFEVIESKTLDNTFVQITMKKK
jgi:dihydrofolate reductase